MEINNKYQLESNVRKQLLISMIVPVVRPEKYLNKLLSSIKGVNSNQVEMIFVNQSEQSIDEVCGYPSNTNIDFIDHRTGGLVSASKARNIGASIAKGEYLFFPDDDAFFFPQLNTHSLLKLIDYVEDNDPDVVIFQRGEVVNDNYKPHCNKEVKTINFANFSNYVIEWNFLIKNRTFRQIGEFIDIGPGSDHACLCGEAFVLFSKIIDNKDVKIKLYPDIKIAHPGLFEKVVLAKNSLGYSYANGYAVGLGLKHFSFLHKIYWTARIFTASVIIDILFRSESHLIPTIEKINLQAYRIAIAKSKISGFWDALISRKPRSKDWLDILSAKLTNSI